MFTSSSFATPKYDVFVSFRGEDVRKNILSHLYHEFARKGIKTFKDEEVESRKQVPASVLRAISDTKVKVLLLSKKYSASSWCLDELVEILKVQSMVVPVYYEVDLSDVRYQTGEFGQDFQRHCKVENQEKLQSWRKALTRLTDIKPDFSSQAVKDDSKLIRQITLCVSDLLSNSCFHKELLPREIQIDKSTTKKASSSQLVSDQVMASISAKSNRPIAMDRHMKVIYGVLDLESTSEVRLIAISGIRGVGKTTIARHLYQELSSAFHYHYFLENSSNIFLHISETQGISNTSIMRSYKNLTPPFQDHCCLHKTSRNFHDQGLVRDTSSSSSQEKNISPRGLKRKAMQALCSDLGSDDQKKARLCHQRVLFIVDNIETIEQLEEIMKDVNLLGPGSRIIVITQDKSLLLKCGVKHVYEVDCLNYDEALELFSQCAFKMQYPPANFEQLSVHAVSVAGFLPLGLKLLGSFLYGRTKEDWVNELERLELKQDKINQKSLAHDVPLMTKLKRIGM